MMDTIEFTEVNNTIPFKQIESLEIYSVQPTQNGYLLQIQYKYGKHKIERTNSDIIWLLDKLYEQNNRFLIIPTLQQNVLSSAWNYLMKNITHYQKRYLQAQQQLQCNIILRVFIIISQITLKYLYSKQSSLFVFIDEKYSLYRSNIFQKQDQFGKLYSFKNKITNKVMEYLPFGRKKLDNKQITQLNNDTKIFEKRIQSMFAQVSVYYDCLSQLRKDFLEKSESKKLQQRHFTIQGIQIQLEMQYKYMQVIRLQIDAISVKITAINELDSEIQKQINNYINFVKEQHKITNEKVVKILQTFYKCIENIENICEIDIGGIYQTYQKQLKINDC